MEHPFFATIDWTLLREKKIPPPFRPRIRNPEDCNNFAQKFQGEKPSDNLHPITEEKKVADQYEGFTFARTPSLLTPDGKIP